MEINAIKCKVKWMMMDGLMLMGPREENPMSVISSSYIST